MAEAEQVVLLTESGHRSGVQEKAGVHHRDTPLHLAFSCYVFNARDELLLTRRALSKTTWPGVWTNTCCGHPAPGEPIEDGVRRRLRQELGIEIGELTLVLPRFRYRAEMGNGVVENEMCPVYRAYTGGEPSPEKSEVEDYEWVGWRELAEGVAARSRDVSPWCAEQIAELAAIGANPGDWPAADAAGLPPAAL
jgi:isopentenyl-diphosphate delta-isomerase